MRVLASLCGLVPYSYFIFLEVAYKADTICLVFKLPRSDVMSPPSSSKACPFCGETILSVAVKCKHCSSMLNRTTPAESANETILADVAANLWRGIEGVGGRLLITSKRIKFTPHAFNLQSIPLEVPFSDIANAVAVNTMYIIPNGMKVCTKSGVVYQFVVWGRQRLVGLINDQVG